MRESEADGRYKAAYEQAHAVMVGRFQHAGPMTDVLALLFRHGVERMTREILLGRGPQKPIILEESAVQPSLFTPLDPLDFLRTEIALPALPALVSELHSVLADDESSAADVANVISRDAGLATFLLRMVNSALYNFPSRIETISRAVALVGRRRLVSLALGNMVFDSMRGASVAHLDMPFFWQHSIACAVVAGQLAECMGESDPERFFVAGLLHDIGRLAVFSTLPERALAILTMCSTYGMPPQDAELRVLGFDHGTLGGMLLRKWNFPLSLAFATLHHHVPERNTRYIEPAVVHIADMVVKGLGIGVIGMDGLAPFKVEAWDKLGLALDQLEVIILGLEDRLREASALLSV